MRKHLPTQNTLNLALVEDLSFPGSVETEKGFGLLVYCWKWACDGRKSYCEETKIL